MILRDGGELPNEMLCNHLEALINQFFKILPLKESEEPSLYEFMSSLRLELIGSKELIAALHNDSLYLSLISILQYLLENECETKVVKREVFKAISICKKLQTRYAEEV